MSELQHLSPEELQTFAEGLLPDGDRAVVESHLVACTRCQAEADEWRSLFMTLSCLPHFEPSLGFTDRVIAGLQGSRAMSVVPWYQRAAKYAGRALPNTTRGWALAAAFLAMPAIAGSAVLAWLLSHPYVTPGALWAFATDRGANALQSLGSGAISWAMKTDVAAWLVRASGQLVHQVGLSGVGALAACGAVAISLSIWVLYKNLFRTPARETNYVSFSF